MTWREPLDALLVLEDGRFFQGTSHGAARSAIGELVFNTSMSGYQEILTDPSYAGQLVTMTSAHIGNYGVTATDDEAARLWASGLIVRSMSPRASNWRAVSSLPQWLIAHDIPCISNVDTRALTRHLRERGVMRAILAAHAQPAELDRLLDELRCSPAYGEHDWTREAAVPRLARAVLSGVSGSEGAQAVRVQPVEAADRVASAARPRVMVLDFGVKHSILHNLLERGLDVFVTPGVPDVQELRELGISGVLVSNGPGDPAALDEAAARLRPLIEVLPCYGICLGHQLLARALGAGTFKLRYGHRGPNQPVKELATGRVSMTSQNHGYAVEADALPGGLEITHINLNDGTVAGFRAITRPVVAVQYHPEAGPGPHDARDFFEAFRREVSVAPGAWRG